MPLQRIDVRFGIARLGDAFAHYVTDGHLVVNVEAFCDDVLAVVPLKIQASDAFRSCGDSGIRNILKRSGQMSSLKNPEISSVYWNNKFILC